VYACGNLADDAASIERNHDPPHAPRYGRLR
jgi:hypothetical protein